MSRAAVVSWHFSELSDQRPSAFQCCSGHGVTEWIINDKLSNIVIIVPPSGGVTQKLQRNLVEKILENFTSAPCITYSDLSVSYELISVLSLLLFHFISPCCVSVHVTGWLYLESFLSLTVGLPISLSFKSSGLDPLFAVTFTQAELGQALRGAGAERQLLSGRGEVFTSGRALAWLGWWRVAGGLLGLLSGFNRSSERSQPPRFKPPELVRIWQYFWAAMG